MNVEQLTYSLIREYAIQYDYRETLKQLEKETKISQIKVTKLEIINYLSMGKLINKNKKKQKPKKTILEVLIDYLYMKFISRTQSEITANSTYNSINNFDQESIKQKNDQSMLKDINKTPESKKSPKQTNFQNQNNQNQKQSSQTNLHPSKTENQQASRQFKMQRKIQQKPQESNYNNNQSSNNFINNEPEQKFSFKQVNNEPIIQNELQKQIEQKQNTDRQIENPQKTEQQKIQFNKKSSKHDFTNVNYSNNNNTTSAKTFKLVKKKRDDSNDYYNKYNQVDVQNSTATNNNETPFEYKKLNFFQQKTIDTNLVFDTNKINKQQQQLQNQPQVIDDQTINNINDLLFKQQQNKHFNRSWVQGFYYHDNYNMFYGLKQKEGGPCGIIAAVQGYVIKNLFYQQQVNDINEILQQRENSLVLSLVQILHLLSSNNQVVLCVSNLQSQNPLNLKQCKQLNIQFENVQDLYFKFYTYKNHFTGEKQQGVIKFAYSCILTKHIENILQEIDNDQCSFIGNHGYCNQEFVNLLLTGRAVSNCFDGDTDLDGMIMKGIQKQSEVGFLTIFEHFKYLNVGDNLKIPIYPIYVICKEYHYSVLFGLDKEILRNSTQKFDIIYYDELGDADDNIRLTVQKLQEGQKAVNSYDYGTGIVKDSDDMIPSLELVMRTKWGNIQVDWNGTQPIL